MKSLIQKIGEIFKKEHTVERYDATGKNLEKAEFDFKLKFNTYDTTGTGEYSHGEFHSWPQSHYDRLISRKNEAKKVRDKAKRKLEILYERAWNRAHELNGEYNALIAEADKALRIYRINFFKTDKGDDKLYSKIKETSENVHAFEKDKLGMQDGQSFEDFLIKYEKLKKWTKI